MNKTIEKKIEKIIKSYCYECKETTPTHTKDFHKYQVNDFISLFDQVSSEVEKETAENICKLLDDIELRESVRGTGTTESWMKWKHIRNSIRDKFVLAKLSKEEL